MATTLFFGLVVSACGELESDTLLQSTKVSPLGATHCLKIETDYARYADGELTLAVDSGHGMVEELSDYYKRGSTVIKKCYQDLVAVEVSAGTNGWIGWILYSDNGGQSYSGMSCPTCSNGHSTAYIIVDGDTNAGIIPNRIMCVDVLSKGPCRLETTTTTTTAILVADTPGWNNGERKHSCSDYESKGWCKNKAFVLGQECSGGDKYNYPEKNCVVCGKGETTHDNRLQNPATDTCLQNLLPDGSGCSQANKCDVCQGDCDKDSECQPGLKCFQRDTSLVPIPGCTSGGVGDGWTYDYCYDPSILVADTPVPTAGPTTMTALECCRREADKLQLKFSDQQRSNGAPAGCMRYRDGRVIYVHKCSNHANCGTTKCNGCTVLQPSCTSNR